MTGMIITTGRLKWWDQAYLLTGLPASSTRGGYHDTDDYYDRPCSLVTGLSVKSTWSHYYDRYDHVPC